MSQNSQLRVPLSEHQMAWVHHVEARDHGPLPHVLSSVMCRLPLDEGLLTKAVGEAASTRDELSGSLDLALGKQPCWVLQDQADIVIDFHDLRSEPEDERDRAVAGALRAAAERPFKLSDAPLCRLVVHQVDYERFRLSIVSHPATFGRRSLAAFVTDVVTRYRDSLGGLPQDKIGSSPESSCADHACEDDERSVRDWAAGFADFSPSSPEFWTTEPTGTGGVADTDPQPLLIRWVELPPELTDALVESASVSGVPMSSLLLAAHAKAVSVASGRADIVVGVEAEDRSTGENGAFAPAVTTPVRLSLAPSKWTDLAEHVAAEVSTARQFRNVSHLRVRNLLNLGRLADSAFACTDIGLEPDLLDADLSPLAEAVREGYVHIPFSGAVCAEFFRGPRTGKLSLRLTAGSELTAGQLTELARLHLEILRRCVHPDDDHRSFPTLPASHRDLVMGEWNSDVRHYPVEWCVHELVEQQAARTPDVVAVVDSVGELTYRELNARANRLARRLLASGIGVGDVVGVHAQRDASLVTSFLGVLKSGAAYLPLDPKQPGDRALYMLEDSNVTIVLTDTTYADTVPNGPWKVMKVDDRSSELAELPNSDIGRTSKPDDLMYVIYTSGSTGLPKGVEVPHSGVVNYLGWCVEAYASKGSGGAPVFSSVAFDMVVPNLYTPLVMGQRVCMLEDWLDTNGIAQRLAALAPFSFIKLTPGQLGVLSELLLPEDARRLTSMLAVGADAFPLRTLRSWRRVDGETPVLNEYGPTEASVGNSVHFVDGSEEDELLPIGQAIPNTTMYVLDADLSPVPIGVPGELYIGGACVVRGYRNRTELTNEKFIDDPFSDVPGARLYRTGDIGRWLPSGSLAFLGRVDDQVKIRGYRVEPAEVEAAMTGHPGIAEAVVSVIGKTRETYALAGYYVAVTELSPDDVREFLAQGLPEYLVPSFLVPIESVPLNANGKVDRKALPQAGSGRSARMRQKSAASSEAGEAIRRMWMEAFSRTHVGVEEIIVDADGGFFQETQFVLQVSGLLGITVREAVHVFGQARTFGELCERLVGQSSRPQVV